MILKTRGDTIRLKFQRVDSNGDVITTAPSAMYLTVKRSWDAADVLIQKALADMTMDEDGTWHVAIQPTETDGLTYGTYVFDLEVTSEDGTITTICKDSLKLTEEATWRENRG